MKDVEGCFIEEGCRNQVTLSNKFNAQLLQVSLNNQT